MIIIAGYKHLTVNHSVNFVDPDSGAYTQNVERLWRDARSIVPKYGRSTDHMSGYIADFIFRRQHPILADRIHIFLKSVEDFYKKELENKEK